MLIKFGGGVIDARGSIGGNTFSRSRFGNYARARTTPINPRSSRQAAIRAAMMILSEQWRESPMDNSKRAAWELYASSVSWTNKLGEVVNLTGFNHFMRSNMALLYTNGSIVTAGPTDFSLPGSDETATFTYTTGAKLDLVYDDTAAWCDEDDAWFIIDAGIPKNNSVNFFDGPWRYFFRVGGNSITPPTSPATGQIWPWIPAIGNKLWLRVSIIRADGRMSSKHVLAPFTVVA